MEIDADLEAVQTLLSFSRAATRQQEATMSSSTSSDESQDQWASSDDSIDHLQSAKVNNNSPLFIIKKLVISFEISTEIDGLYSA
jgi:hypothetical protein